MAAGDCVTCKVGGCGGTRKKRGWCNKHYKLWRRWGDPLGSFKRTPPELRFWAKVNKVGPMPAQGVAPGCCWMWRGAKTPGGYGQFRPDYRGPSVVSHRYAYELLVGPIPDGLQLDHLCRTRACVNPAHLEPVTQIENIRRGFSVATFNRLKTHCPQDHPYDTANTYINPTTKGRFCRACARERGRLNYQRKKAA